MLIGPFGVNLTNRSERLQRSAFPGRNAKSPNNWALESKFNEVANEEAGDHFTPREVIKLMVNILFDPDDATLTKKGIIRTLYDPTCGTGGMLTTAGERLQQLNPDAQLVLFGQDYNPEAYAICCADMLIKGDSLDNIKFGDTLGDGKTEDYLPDHKFHYMLANPPFGVKWEVERTPSSRSTRARATTAASVPASRASTMGRSSSSST